jgi:hypothetical protein
MGAQKHGMMERGNYLFHSENTRKLNSGDRKKLAEVLRSLDEDVVLKVNPERQEVVFEEVMVTESLVTKPLVTKTPSNNFQNPVQTWDINNIDFTLSKTKRKISDKFRLFDVPQNIYGDRIIPKTIVLHDYSVDTEFDITDDGNGNLVAGTNLFSRQQEIGEFNNNFKVGNDNSCDGYWSDV